jgi:simple sugar transport system permease protein
MLSPGYHAALTRLKSLFNRLSDNLPLGIALAAAVAAASLLLIALEASPIAAFSSMAQGAFGTENSTAETLVKAIPILFVAIGICIAFRGGVINIGGEGQMIAGALAGTTAALVLGANSSLGILIIPLSLLAGFAAGAFYGGLAGFLKAYFNVNEILSTIMLNQVAAQLMNFLLNGILLDPAEVGVNRIPKTARIIEAAELPRLSIVLPPGIADFFQNVGIAESTELFARTRLHAGFLIAVILAIVIYILLWRTTIGYRIRAVGQNERAARYAGINIKFNVVLSMLLAGGMAGLAGVVQVLGLQYRLQTDGSPAGFTGSAGFNGIVAALFGGLNPLGAIPASIFFGGLLVGAQKMQRDLGVSASLITAINGLIVVFVVSSQWFIKKRSRRRMITPSMPVAVSNEPPAEPKPAAAPMD